jgi:hypothetical protein
MTIASRIVQRSPRVLSEGGAEGRQQGDSANEWRRQGNGRLPIKGGRNITKNSETLLRNILPVQTGRAAARPIKGDRIAADEKWRGWQDVALPLRQSTAQQKDPIYDTKAHSEAQSSAG